MSMFDTVDFSYQGEDKGLDFSPSGAEDLFEDLFAQYVSQESPSSSDNLYHSNGAGAFEISLAGDAALGGSNAGDHLHLNGFASMMRRSQRFPQHNIRYTQSHEILPSHVYQRFPRHDRPKAAISGLELLKLEGKSPFEAQPAETSLALTSATNPPPLRRKPRFSAKSTEALRCRNLKVSKGSETSIGEVSMTMPPSYYYQHETPELQEWHQRFENISLQTRKSNISHPSSRLEDLHEEKHAPNISITKSTGQSAKQARQHTGPSALDMIEFESLPPDLKGNMNQPHQTHTMKLVESQEVTGQGKRGMPSSPTEQLASPWPEMSGTTENLGYTISPHQLHITYPDGMQNGPYLYDASNPASQSTPALSCTTRVEYSIASPKTSFDQAHLGNDPNSCFPVDVDPFYANGLDIYPPLPPPNALFQRPPTPSTRSSSPCPSPSPNSKTPSRNRRRSKSSRRKPSAGTLKPATSLGFINFTPGDSHKILNGVAPSGSSKTKARREQEANERKRKLSLAAEKVVLEAGGDVEKLRAACLFT